MPNAEGSVLRVTAQQGELLESLGGVQNATQDVQVMRPSIEP